MQYKKYFKPGQRVILKTLTAPTHAECIETLSTSLVRCDKDLFELAFPYRQPAQECPFETDADFEVLSEAFGLGLRFVGRFLGKAAEDILRIRADGNLEFFYRRRHPRTNASIGLLYSRGKGGLRTVRAQWARGIQALESGKGLPNLPPFNRSRINLSAGGVRFPVKMAIEVAELFLIFLDIEDGNPPICALSEVVWVDAPSKDGSRTTGTRFINILEADQKRIERFVRAQPEVQENSTGEDDPDGTVPH